MGGQEASRTVGKNVLPCPSRVSVTTPVMPSGVETLSGSVEVLIRADDQGGSGKPAPPGCAMRRRFAAPLNRYWLHAIVKQIV
jgi:hypothetical protein